MTRGSADKILLAMEDGSERERLAGILETHWGTSGLQIALAGYEKGLFQELDLIDRLVAACYAASGSFRYFSAATMLYFAAVITYERQRSAHRGTDTPFERLFLCADDHRLTHIAEETLERLARSQSDTGSAFEDYVEDAIRPYNTVGLFHPAIRNMYHHTAAPS